MKGCRAFACGAPECAHGWLAHPFYRKDAFRVMSEITVDHPPNWDDLVAEGRKIEAGRNAAHWAHGDLAREVETEYGAKSLERFAADIDLAYNSLRTYRYVAARWENDTRVSNVSWAVHREFAALDDRHELIRSRPTWTTAEARDLVKQRRAVVAEVVAYVDQARNAITAARKVILDVGLDDAKRDQLRIPLRRLDEEVDALNTQVFPGGGGDDGENAEIRDIGEAA